MLLPACSGPRRVEKGRRTRGGTKGGEEGVDRTGKGGRREGRGRQGEWGAGQGRRKGGWGWGHHTFWEVGVGLTAAVVLTGLEPAGRSRSEAVAPSFRVAAGVRAVAGVPSPSSTCTQKSNTQLAAKMSEPDSAVTCAVNAANMLNQHAHPYLHQP